MAHGVLTRISNSITGGGWRARLATRRPYVVLATLLLLVLAGVVLFRRPEDWHKVYIPMGRWLLEGRDIYDVQSTGFTYPPAMALMALPFGLVPPLAARAAYILLSSASLITFWWASWRTATGQQAPGESVRWRTVTKTREAPNPTWRPSAESAATDLREHAVLALGMLVGLRFVTDVLEDQQTDMLIAALVAGAGYLVLRGRWLTAAVCCGLGAGLKATPLIWVLYFLVCRRWRAVLVLVAVAVGINLLPDFVSHPSQARLWLQRWILLFLVPLASGQLFGQWHTVPVLNQSLAGTLHRLLMLSWPHTRAEYFSALPQARVVNAVLVRWVIQAACGALLLLGLGAIALPRWRRGKGLTAQSGNHPATSPDGQPKVAAGSPSGSQLPTDVPRVALECSIMLLLMVLLSPASSKPHFLIVLLPAYCLARLALYGRDRLSATCLGVALLSSLLSNRSIMGLAIGEPVQWAGGITWCALSLLLGCVTALLRATRPSDDAPRSHLGPPSRDSSPSRQAIP